MSDLYIYIYIFFLGGGSANYKLNLRTQTNVILSALPKPFQLEGAGAIHMEQGI